LRRLDRERKVFGSAKHHYRSSPTPLEDIRDFEKNLGVELPTEYRDYLRRIGYGAGPYYGIWCPHEVLAELQGLARDFEADEGVCVRPSDPFPLTPAELGGIVGRLAVNSEAPWADQAWPCGGCIPICHQGCTYWSVLVLQGEFRGRVWDVACFAGYDGEWLPARRPPGWWELGMPHPKSLPDLPSPPTFIEWVSGWLERGLTDLGGL
jgi:hypothetical protein